MSYQRIFISALADFLLLGHWQSKVIIKNIYFMLQSRPTWVVPLVNRIFVNFQDNLDNTSKNQLINFISHDEGFIQIWSQQRQELHIHQYNVTRLPSPPAKLKCNVPRLEDLNQLSKWLGISFDQLENYSANWRSHHSSIPQRHYHYHWIPKKNGFRLIEAPKQRMASIQRQIYLGILDHIPLHYACHGFRKQHSCQTYVTPHTGKDIVIRLDLHNFFTSIPFRRIHALFTTLGYPPSVAKCLAGLCCNQVPLNIIKQNPTLSWQQRKQLLAPHLPQGCPTSPMLANLASYKLDLRLSALTDKLNGNYSRYADDLAFSGNEQFKRYSRNLPALVAHIVLSEGFSINHRKTKIMHQAVSQRLTGMTLNSFPNYPRKEFDQLKAILFNCVRFGVLSQNKENRVDFKAHLQGRIAFVKALNPAKAEKLSSLFEQIKWGY